MSRVSEFEPVFVDEIPRDLAPGKLYVSIKYTTVTHLCACGCGNEVVTPLHPARWALTYDGERVSLWPSVGSWNLPCRSHYVIEHNKAQWAEPWSDSRISAGRRRDRAAIAAHFGPEQKAQGKQFSSSPETSPNPSPWWHRVRNWLGR
jgi:Family of unknown function (DUF6527)